MATLLNALWRRYDGIPVSKLRAKAKTAGMPHYYARPRSVLAHDYAPRRLGLGWAGRTILRWSRSSGRRVLGWVEVLEYGCILLI